MTRIGASLLLLLILGCGSQPDAGPHSIAAESARSPSHDAADSVAGPVEMAGADFDSPATVAPEIAAAWAGVRIKLVDRETGEEQFFDIPLGGADILGDSGLVVSAGVFLPDFILDENGISSRSDEPINPAVRVVISEDGMEDFEGWLFASMPEFHPYPNTRYHVVLVEGIPKIPGE